jgi:chemotaxis protein CheD
VKHVVGVAEMKLSASPDDLLVTHALGSCLGIAVHDPVVRIGGLVHVMMPQGNVNPQKAEANPFMFVDTGIPAFFREIYKSGGLKGRLVVKVAGGANVHNADNDRFAIGKRNYIVLKKLFWKNSILIDAEDTGGIVARTMYLEIGSGRVWLSTAGVEKQL